uniref:Interleukin n=1 Tax=Nothobranchius furzeri TaxID=105023 RepID=A0A8C6NJC6_NOTFU
MQSLTFCILTVCCFAWVSTTSKDTQRRKLQQLRAELITFQKTLKDKEKNVITPPKNIEGCCCLSAFKCFRDNLKAEFNITNKLSRGLTSNITMKALDLCETGNNATMCEVCVSHSKERAEEFFSRLDTLIQRGIARLSMK